MLRSFAFRRYNVVKQATRLVEAHVALLEAVYEARKTRSDGHSRLQCSCPVCQRDQEATLAWIAKVRENRVTSLAGTPRR
jgi:hypothetical protein